MPHVIVKHGPAGEEQKQRLAQANARTCGGDPVSGGGGFGAFQDISRRSGRISQPARHLHAPGKPTRSRHGPLTARRLNDRTQRPRIVPPKRPAGGGASRPGAPALARREMACLS
jgi:hypothetical protein